MQEPDPEDCRNGVDDDGDGKTDCHDPDCRAHVACSKRGAHGGRGREVGRQCLDGKDNDRDGLIDCHDPDCSRDPRLQKHCNINKKWMVCTVGKPLDNVPIRCAPGFYCRKIKGKCARACYGECVPKSIHPHETGYQVRCLACCDPACRS